MIARLSGPPEGSRAHLWVVDGALIPMEGHAVTACSKNYRRSVSVQITIRAMDRRVIVVGDSWPGNRNGIVVFRATLANQVARHWLLIGDGAYRSAPENQRHRPRCRRAAQPQDRLCLIYGTALSRTLRVRRSPGGVSRGASAG
ncbi:hypothetical protein ACWDSL_04685 [Streptomyces sp. NPDC000941]